MWWYFAFLAYSLGMTVTWQMLTLGGYTYDRPIRGNKPFRRVFAAMTILLFTAFLAFVGALLFAKLLGTERWTGALIAFSILSQLLLLVAYCALARYTMEITMTQAVYLVIYAYLSESISAYVYEFLVQFTSLTSVLPLYPLRAPADYLLFILVKAGSIALLYFLVGKRLAGLQWQYERTDGGDINQYIFALLGLIVLSNVITFNVIFTITDGMTTVRIGLMFICLIMCILAFLFMLALFSAVVYKVRESATEQLRLAEREQFKITRENIEIINRKCHDLKHQLRTILSETGKDKGAFLRELEEAVSIYDSTIRTGNKYIDVTLSDKSLRCQENGIQILTVLDGSAFDFIDKYDLNSIFGNLLDNAIEYLRSIPQPDKRFVRILGHTDEFGVILTVENYLEDVPEITEEKLPRTTKGSTAHHGFGLHNVRKIVESYNGVMTIDTSGHLFAVKIMFLVD